MSIKNFQFNFFLTFWCGGGGGGGGVIIKILEAGTQPEPIQLG